MSTKEQWVNVAAGDAARQGYVAEAIIELEQATTALAPLVESLRDKLSRVLRHDVSVSNEPQLDTEKKRSVPLSDEININTSRVKDHLGNLENIISLIEL